jgi:hypothetical protein
LGNKAIRRFGNTTIPDYSKAFGRVSHKGLIAKLRSSGINGSLLLWFESYLTGRQQRVIIEGTSSEWKNVQAGVPQGSVLGPLEKLQIDAARLVTGAIKGTSRESLLKETAWLRLRSRRSDHKLFIMFKILNNLAPPYLLELRTEHTVRTKSAYTLRTHDDLCVPFARTERLQKSFAISSIKLWNSLPIPNALFYIGNRYSSILHTRLRLFHCTLKIEYHGNALRAWSQLVRPF